MTIKEGYIKRDLIITEDQNYALEIWKQMYRRSCSQLIGNLIDYFMKNNDKLKEIIKKEKNMMKNDRKRK